MAPLLQEQSHTPHYGVASLLLHKRSKQAPANLRISSRFKGTTLTLQALSIGQRQSQARLRFMRSKLLNSK